MTTLGLNYGGFGTILLSLIGNDGCESFVYLVLNKTLMRFTVGSRRMSPDIGDRLALSKLLVGRSLIILSSDFRLLVLLIN